MERVILVIDKPKSCSNCRFCQYSYEGMRICAAEDTSDHGVHTSIEENYYSDIKPNWCPLKPMPEYVIPGDFSDEYGVGWNDCLDEIIY